MRWHEIIKESDEDLERRYWILPSGEIQEIHGDDTHAEHALYNFTNHDDDDHDDDDHDNDDDDSYNVDRACDNAIDQGYI